MNPKADWGRAATSKPVLTAVPLNKWAIIYVEKNETVVRNFCKIMQQQGPRMGLQIANPKPIKIANDRTESYLKELRSIINPSVQLVGFCTVHKISLKNHMMQFSLPSKCFKFSIWFRYVYISLLHLSNSSYNDDSDTCNTTMER